MSRRAQIEEVDDSDEDDFSDPSEEDIEDVIVSRGAAAQQRAPAPAQQQQQRPTTTGPPPTYTGFPTLYPVYFDKDRSRAAGRRVGRALAVANPLARDIVDACTSLGLRTVFEPTKTHPKDWANPGRVKVELRTERGGPPTANAAHIKGKHHLYILVARYLATHPTTEASAGLRATVRGAPPPPPLSEPYPRPAVPRGWKLPALVPYLSPAMTGGGVSENLFQDVMKEMQGAGGGSGGGGGGLSDMQKAMASLGAAGGGGGGGSDGGKKGKKGKGRA